MSKAFLFIALALVIACASAKFFTISGTTAGLDPVGTECAKVGYLAGGKFWIIGDLADAAAFKKEGTDYLKCNDELKDASAGGAVDPVLIEDVVAKDAACFATGAKAGAATACGVATAGACDTNIWCATDNQCVDKVCKAEARYVVTIPKDTKEADAEAAVKTVLEGLKYTPAGGAEGTPCKTTAPTVKLIGSVVSKGWALVSIDATGDCKAAIVAAAATVKNVQAAECTVCVDTFDYTNTLLGTCPCADPAELFSQARFTLVEGKKQKDAEKFFKDAFAASAGKCYRALTFLPAGTGKFVMQYVYKNPLVDETCKKESEDGGSKQADEFKLIATVDTSFKVAVKALVTECASTDVIKCVADDAKCVGLVCGKTGACTAANQVDVCASSVCDVKEGATDGKCNSASVVGYVVAVVAVIAAFVF